MCNVHVCFIYVSMYAYIHILNSKLKGNKGQDLNPAANLGAEEVPDKSKKGIILEETF